MLISRPLEVDPDHCRPICGLVPGLELSQDVGSLQLERIRVWVWNRFL